MGIKVIELVTEVNCKFDRIGYAWSPLGVVKDAQLVYETSGRQGLHDHCLVWFEWI